MCFELCGPPLNGDAVEDAAYEAWLDSLDSEDEIEEEEEEEQSSTISEHDALARFDEFLDECWENVWVCGYEFTSSRALKELDPIAYREEFNNWLNSEGLELE